MKKDHEESILKDFQRTCKYKFTVLNTNDAQKVFPEYNGENPDFIVQTNDGTCIGIELFRLSAQDKPIKGPDGKLYKNLPHLTGENKEAFNIKTNDFPPDPIKVLFIATFYEIPDEYSCLTENLNKKSNKTYVTENKNTWIIAYSSEWFHEWVSDSENMRKEISSYFTQFDKIFLFQTQQQQDEYYLLELNSDTFDWHTKGKTVTQY